MVILLNYKKTKLIIKPSKKVTIDIKNLIIKKLHVYY